MATYVDGNSVIVETKNKKVGKPQAAPTSSGVSQQAIDAMISGKAFDPYRQAANESMARSTQQQRAAVAAQLSSRGMNNSGFGAQIARSTDSGIRQEGLQNRLNMDIAQQNMRAQGVGMQQTQQQINSQAANNAAMREIERARLAQDAMMESNRNALTREQLKIQKDLGLGDQQLRSRTLDIQEAQWQDELGLKREDFALRQQLGLEDLSLRSRALDAETQRAAKQLDLQFKELDQRDKQVMAQIQLGYDQITAEDRRFMEQLGLSRDAQKWLEQYQKQSLALDRERIGQQGRLSQDQLDLQNRQFQYNTQNDPNRNNTTMVRGQDPGFSMIPRDSYQTVTAPQGQPVYMQSNYGVGGPNSAQAFDRNELLDNMSWNNFRDSQTYLNQPNEYQQWQAARAAATPK